MSSSLLKKRRRISTEGDGGGIHTGRLGKLTEVVGTGTSFLDSDSSRTDRNSHDIVVSRREVSLIERAFDRLARGSVAVTNATLIEFQR